MSAQGRTDLNIWGGTPDLPGLHPDRRVDQLRQLRRPAVQHPRRGDRHQHRDQHQRPGHRLRDPDQPGEARRRPAARERQGAARVARRPARRADAGAGGRLRHAARSRASWCRTCSTARRPRRPGCGATTSSSSSNGQPVADVPKFRLKVADTKVVPHPARGAARRQAHDGERHADRAHTRKPGPESATMKPRSETETLAGLKVRELSDEEKRLGEAGFGRRGHRCREAASPTRPGSRPATSSSRSAASR